RPGRAGVRRRRGRVPKFARRSPPGRRAGDRIEWAGAAQPCDAGTWALAQVRTGSGVLAVLPAVCESPERARRRGTSRGAPPPALLREAGLMAGPRIMFVSSNGTGLGHLTRSMAIARRLDRDTESLFVTL